VLGGDKKLGACKILAKSAEIQREVQRVGGESSIYLQKVLKKLLRSITLRNQTEAVKDKSLLGQWPKG